MTAYLPRARALQSSVLACALLLPPAIAGCATGSDPTIDARPMPRDAGGDGSIDPLDAPMETCTDDSECDDGDACTGIERCASNVCVAGTAVDCDDTVGCTVDACDTATGACTSTPDDTRCASDLVCDPVDDCSAPRPCTIDDDCDDMIFCNGTETCDVSFGCRRGAAPTCDDGRACTIDACDATTDACVAAPDAAMCDDDLVCNGTEACDPSDPAADGAGCVIGAAPVCDDGVACTVDVCMESAAGCATMPDDLACSDGVFCNGAEICGAAGCGPGAAPTCDDGIGCTIGSCDAATDACVQAGDDPFCQDGMVCNGSERCDTTGVTTGRGCVAGVPRDCSDGLACTTDGCVEPGTCTHGGSDADSDGYQAVGCGSGNDCNDLSAAIHPGATELCDGVDNDCSGTIDDGGSMECALGSAPRSCTTSCTSAGVQACNSACRLGPCFAAAELCNDCDDDGDGLVDDGLACRRGTSSSCTTSCSTAGSRVCASDCSGFGACVAASETCNDCDDDGDGMVDDGLACRRGTSRTCTTSCMTPGSQVCAVDCSGHGVCRAASETCNGCDDDGNGTADDGLACRLGQTQSCTTTCAAGGVAGVRTCAGDCSGYGACLATEICNGCDDDGDGAVDDGFTCAVGATRGCAGPCGSGTQTCTSGCGWGACTATEICNACDDDADGMSDEDFACAQGATMGCTTSCMTGGSRTCSATCSGYGACSATEQCNGCDDDADGTPDDGFFCRQGTTQSCPTACGTTGNQTCNGTCSAYSTCTATEVCNGCDDDVDGMSDDGFFCPQGATQMCSTGCGTPGSQTCNGACTAYGTCSGAEVCNACDDDADGTPDDGFFCRQGLTQSCATACGTTGSQTCNGGCSAFSTCIAATETCGNSCDDDGDGMIDEGCVVTPPNDRCTAATAYTIGSTVSSTTAGATNDYASSCALGSGSPDVAYSFTSTGSATSYRIHVDTTVHDGSIHIHSASTCASGDEVACNDDFGGTRASEITLTNPPAGTYYIVVDGYSTGNSGPFTLTSSTTTLNPDACGGVPITANGRYSGTTVGRAANYTGTCGLNTGASPDVVYSITARTTGTITLSTCGSTYDTVMYVATTCGSSTQCDDDAGTGACGELTSVINLAVTAGVTYYVVVDGYNGASGAYNLDVSGY